MSDSQPNPLNFDPDRAAPAPVLPLAARTRLHPLLAAAAVSVIALSGTGMAYFAGVLPGAKAQGVTTQPVAALAATSDTSAIPGTGTASAPLVVVNTPKASVVEPNAANTVATAPVETAKEPAIKLEQPKPVARVAPPSTRATSNQAKPVAKIPVLEQNPPAQSPSGAQQNGRVQPPSTSVGAPVVAGAPTGQNSPGTVYSTPPVTPPVAANTPVPTVTAPQRVEPPVQVAQACTDCGRVESIREVKVPGKTSGAGVIIGGAIGGVLGNQVGKGGGRAAATVLGAFGGAMAGNALEKQNTTSMRYDVGVRMQDGSLRTVSYNARPVWQIGQTVRMNGSTIAYQDGTVPQQPTIQQAKPRRDQRSNQPEVMA